MIGVDFQKAIVALISWQAMRGEGVNAMLGACFVFRNQAKTGEPSDDIYTCAKLHAAHRGVVGFPDTRHPQFLMLLQYMDGVFDDTLVDNITNGALAFERPHHKDALVCANIGPVLFYK
jgi:hypothetical protein